MSDHNKIDEAFEKLDQELQTMAGVDFQKFCQLTGVNKKQAIVCLERAKGLSFAQIEIKYNIPKQTAVSICKKCT